jgi:PKD repeat protein
MIAAGCGGRGEPPSVALVCDVSPSPSLTVTWSEEFRSDGSSDTVTWDFGDGQVFTSHDGSSPANGHPYARPGNYVITLTVKDADGIARDTCDVTVPGR